MKTHPALRKLLLLLLALPLVCHAQFASNLNNRTAKGTFYVSVDDGATIYVNGQKFYDAPLNESRSPEMELKTGDRIVVHLRNDTAGRRFLMLFAGSDGQTIVSFRARDFKIVPDMEVVDFTPEQLAKWQKQPKTEHRKDNLPVKGYSDWMWGDHDKSIIAGTVTAQMFSQRPK